MTENRHKLAYWLLGTSREELREQFRRVEGELGNGTELKQVQAMLGIDPSRKPAPHNVDDREENYFERLWSH